MTTILITGARGQLGSELGLLLSNNPHCLTLLTDIDTLDITRHEAINTLFADRHIDVAINCAAYTAVDRAEADADRAALLNAEAPRLLAQACARHGAKMLQVSTDYVFDGQHNTPYLESDPPHPRTVYGRTKLAGEQAVAQTLPDAHIILRTAWLYSPFGHNFVKTMLSRGREKSQLSVVYDQVGTPTYAAHLAQAIESMVTAPQWHAGTYHYTNEGVASWYDLAVAAHRLAGIDGCHIDPVASDEYPTPAMRPHYSVLSKQKIRQTFGLDIPHWHDALAQCISRLQSL